MPRPNRFVCAAALLLAVFLLPSAAGSARTTEPTLLARAVLPADTFLTGPASGLLLGTAPINGRTPPFPGQPVQGISALIDAGHGTFWAMPDNGFGNKANSSDFLLRVYRVKPEFETKDGGPGTIDILGFVQFRDPDGRIPWPIVNGATADRLLTGSDFDIESIRIDRRGLLGRR
jgi:glycerophosphoryl diester phosphodiesterase